MPGGVIGEIIAGGVGGAIKAIGAKGAANKLADAAVKAGNIKAAASTKAAQKQAKAAKKGGNAQLTAADRAMTTIQDYGDKALGAQTEYLDDQVNVLKDAESRAIAEFKGYGDQAVQRLEAAGTEATGYLKPYRDVGEAATYSLADLYGLPTPANPEGGPGLTDEAIAAWEKSPDYVFAKDQAIKAADRTAASKGMLRSGGQIREIEELAGDLASKNYQNYLGRLMEMSKMGESAAVNSGQFAQQTGGNVATTLQNTGGGTAEIITGTGGRIAGAYGDAGDDISSIYGDVGRSLAIGEASKGDITANKLKEVAGFKAGGLLGAADAFASAITGKANAQAAGDVAATNILGYAVSDAFSNANFGGALKSGSASL